MDKLQSSIEKAMKVAENKKTDYRLRYHITPPAGLLNNPSGLCYFDEKYHVFYQWNPLELNHTQKLWGHVTSSDMIHWEQEQSPYALLPTDKYDKDGCYSGSAIVHENKMHVLYTGNVGTEESGPNRRKTANQILASYNSETDTFDKHGVVIKGVPFGWTPHFRDPKVWQFEDKFFTVIGGQKKVKTGKVGAAFVYSSKNLKRWKKVGELKTSLEKFGQLWECPDIFKLDGKDVFLFSPQGIEPEGYKYQNKEQSGYVVGLFDERKAIFDQFSQFEEIDRGHEFYAPQTFSTPDGRRVMIAWMGMPGEEEHPTIKEGWMHALTIPRELSMKGNRIIQKPIRELKELRQDKLEYGEFIVEDEIWEREELVGDAYELCVDVNVLADSFELIIKSSVRIIYNREKSLLTLERQGAHPKYKESRSVELSGENHKIQLQVFVDKSSIEIFVNGGAEVFTSRIFPKKDARSIQLKAIDGVVEVTQIKKYELAQVFYTDVDKDKETE